MSISVQNIFTSVPKPTRFDDGTIAAVGRPRDVRSGVPVHEHERMYAIPRHPLAYITIYQGMYMSLPWRFAINTKKQEKYRRGISVYPRFSAKCKNCNEEYLDTSPDQPCPDCGENLIAPDPKEKRGAEDWQENVNLNSESLQDLMEQAHEDICVADEGYILFRKDYIADKSGKIKYQTVKETIWGSPIVMRPCVDHRSGAPGGMYWVCPGEHRNDPSVVVVREKREEGHNIVGGQNYEVDPHPPKCEKCGLVMEDVHFVSIFHERGEIENYYIKGEVVHWHEYNKSHTFSVPPGVTLWVPSSIITYKDAYIRDSYMKQRKPRGAVVASTSNPDDFMNKWDVIMEKVKGDWQYMPVIPLEPEPGISANGSQRIAWVDFMGSMQDLDYVKIRDVYERQLLQWYGVGNIFANIETGGGSRGSGEVKLIISNRHVERSNTIDNRVLRRISVERGMKDWFFKINPPEDKDVLKEEHIHSTRIANAQMMTSIGFDAQYSKKTKMFDFRPDPQKEMGKAISMMNVLISLKDGQLITEQGGGQPPPMTSFKPMVDSSEPSGSAVDGVAKALNDPRVHEGDVKPTQASSHKPSNPGQGGSKEYTAPDGSRWPSKQAYGGHQKGLGTGGQAPGNQGAMSAANGGMGMEMPVVHSKQDYLDALEKIEEAKVVSMIITDMLREYIENMEDPANASSVGCNAPPDQD